MSLSRAITLFAIILYITSIEANGRTRSSNSNSNNNNNWGYVLYTPGAMRHGLQGSAISPTNMVTVGSVLGEQIYEVDVNAGTFTTFVPSPNGMADDEAFGPDGTLVFNSLLEGLVHSRLTNGTILTIASDLPVSPNGIAFDTNGDCYFSEYPNGYNRVWKVDPHGKVPQQLAFTATSGINGFDFDSQNHLYGPMPFTGQVAKINLQTQTETIVPAQFIDPESARFNADKTVLYVLDSGLNTIFAVNVNTGAKTAAAKINGLVYLDNFRPYGNGFLVSDTTSNSLINYNMYTNTYSYVTPVSVFNLPQGISFYNGIMYIADFACQKTYTPSNGQLTTIARSGPQPASAGVSAVNISFGLWSVAASSSYLAVGCFYDLKVQVRNRQTNADIVDDIPLLGEDGVYGLGWSSDEKTLYFNDYGYGLRVNTGPNFQTSRTIFVGDNNLVGLAVSQVKANTVYVTDYNGKIYTVNTLTGTSSVLASGFNGPEGLAVFAYDNEEVLVVANVGTQQVIAVSTSGEKLVLASNLPIGLAGPNTIAAPNTFTGVAIDSNANVYITSDLNDALIKLEVACH